MNLRDFTSVAARRRAIANELSLDLPHIGSFTLDELIASTRNCENMIGAAQVPMGVAGPLQIGKEQYYIPLATTEGALVASVNRGCKAITESGGAQVHSHRIGATRGPVFKVKNLAQNSKLYEFLETHHEELEEIAAKTSSHLNLKKITSQGVGKYRFVRFVFNTQDAMGMNMATIATQALVGYIEKHTGAQCLSVAGNYDVDKKPAWLNIIRNRGIKAWAEVTLAEHVLQKVLKTSAQKVHETWLAKCMIGSAVSGSMGFNAHMANVIAAMFLATGQDPGHVGEGSCGITTTEIMGKDLYASVYLPDLMVGTVGGGTGLATQKEALSILGVAGPSADGDGRNAMKLAEIVAAAVLAGEISLLSSLGEGSLARAHERLARGIPNDKNQMTNQIQNPKSKFVI